MASINLNFYKKSYMLEFMENDTVTEVFTFSVPPENEQFDFSQRVVETKTFGGSVFENYGNDTIRITLSGCTGNGESKLIYRGTTKSKKYLTGENEIWYLQELLEDWHNTADGLSSAEKKIYLYDLSKMSTLELAAMSPTRNWWRVIVKNFQIKRQVSKPIYYNYTLELLGLVEESHAEESLLKTVSDTVNDITETIDTVNDYVSATTDTFATLTSAVETVQEEFEALNSISGHDDAIATWTSGADTVSRALGVNTNTSFYTSTVACQSAADNLAETITGDSVYEGADYLFGTSVE